MIITIKNFCLETTDSRGCILVFYSLNITIRNIVQFFSTIKSIPLEMLEYLFEFLPSLFEVDRRAFLGIVFFEIDGRHGQRHSLLISRIFFPSFRLSLWRFFLARAF